MATATIYPNQVSGYSFCGPYNGSGAGILGDINASTGWANIYGTTAASITVYRDTGMPADFVGATINSVVAYRYITTNLQRGTANINVYRDGNTTTLATLGPGFSTGSQSVTRPGGGSWVYTDFYVSTLTWQWAWHGNADDATKTCLLEELFLVVDYTPPSPPTAAFTASTTTGTSPLSVTFTDQSTNTPTSWSWSFGDGQTSTAQNPVNVYSTTATSTYTVTLTAANAGGTDSEQKTSYITVDPAATAVAAEFVGSPLSGVQNLSVRFTDQSSGTPAPTSWTWNFGDSSTSTEQNPTHVYTTVGTYTVTLTASNATPTTDTETKSSYVTVLNGKPVPAASCSTTTGVLDLTVEFTGSATNALPTSWDWDFGDGTGSVAQSPTHEYVTVGTFTPTLTVGNAIGTASTTTGPITVAFDTITATFEAAPLMGYIPLTVRFTDESSGSANSWAWAFGDGQTSSEQHPVHVYYTNAGVATVTITQTGYADDYNLRHGLTNYWKMEESTGTGDRVDFVGSADLSTGGSTVAQVSGKNSYAAQLDLNEELRRSSGIAWTGAYSYSMWFNVSTVANQSVLIASASGQGSSEVQVSVLNTAKLRLVTPGPTVISGTTSLTAATWYHLVLTFDGTSAYKLYLNGVLELSGTDSATNAETALFLGCPLGVGATVALDEVGRYGIAIDQDQITGLYNAGSGEFFNVLSITDTVALTSSICPIIPDATWGYFFEETKYMMMEPTFEQNVCEGFDAFGGMAKAVALTQKRLERFVLETAALRKEATLSAADSDSENFALPTDMIELLRVEVNGTPYYPADQYQEDYDNSSLNTYWQRDALSITIPGTFGSTPTVKVLYTYVPSAPSVPAPCTCPTPPTAGPWGAFPLPYVLWWIIRYGLMADFFNQAGERNDPERAGKCEEMFTVGVQLYKYLYRGNS